MGTRDSNGCPKIPTEILGRLKTCNYVCGSDECGLGAWAGNLTVCATITPRDWTFPGVTDSKKLTATARERLYPVLSKTLTHCIVHINPEEIDREGVGNVWLKAHVRAIQGALEAHKALGHTDTPLVIADGNRSVPGAISLPKADLLIPAVSAASILAKVTRDRLMREMDVLYPGYGFSRNCAYGTQEHRAALERLGVCPIHRMSYSPMSSMKKTPEVEQPDLFDLLAEVD